jgi:DNA (cytosine-5)-methyltransferase 1
VNELSLFTGAGGGVLGTKLLGWKSVGYVEWDKYCQQVLAQRIEDGFLDEAPIFGDIDHFIESGASKKYQGFVDVVTAGFPCQPFSVAGKGRGEKDERNKWPQTIECIRDVRPRYALLENVPGLLNSGYFGEILTSLAEAGFDARWCVLGADDVGAPHRRKRLWILAYPHGKRLEEHGHGKATHAFSASKDVQDPERSGCLHREHEKGRIQVREQRESSSRGGERVSGDSPDVADSGSSRLAYPSTERSRDDRGDWWSTEPDVGRVAHGVASRVDRLKALGNGQVPAVAATAWTILSTGT